MASDAELGRTRECHCLAARSEARRITRLYEEHLRPHGLRATQFTVLAALAIVGRAPINELATSLGLERTTLTRSSVLLERDGYIRVAHSEDGRRRPLELTRAGRHKLDEAYPAWKEVQDRIDRERAGA